MLYLQMIYLNIHGAKNLKNYCTRTAWETNEALAYFCSKVCKIEQDKSMSLSY